MKTFLLLIWTVKSQHILTKDTDGRLEILTPTGEEFEFAANNEIASGFSVYPEWSFSVEIFIQSHFGSFPNVLEMYNRDENDQKIACQNKIPWVFFGHNPKNGQKYIGISYNCNNEKRQDDLDTWITKVYTANQWHTISMSQSFNGSDFIFEAGFDNDAKEIFVNTAPRVYSNVIAKQEIPSDDTLIGKYRNFNFTTFDNGHASTPDCDIADVELECTSNEMKLMFNNCQRVNELYLTSHEDFDNKTSLAKFNPKEKLHNKCGKVQVSFYKSHHRYFQSFDYFCNINNTMLCLVSLLRISTTKLY